MHTDRFRCSGDPNLAIFIMRTDDGTHTGILHRMRDVLMMQDLQWHERFRSQPCNRPSHFVVLALEAEEEHDVRAMCRLIHDRHNSGDPSSAYRMPYAFRHGNNNRFNSSTGELMLADGLGLTCSTFVLTVFESVEVPLVDFDGWEQRAEDNARHETLLDKMRNGIPKYGIPAAQPDHVDRVAAELPCIRVRPEEVAATGLFNDLPATYAQLEPAGAWILSQLLSA
jgi:hypothetical protein